MNNNISTSRISMKTKEVYEKNKARKYCAISEINEEGVKLESTPLKEIKKNPYVFLIGSIVITVILFITLHNDLRAFLVGLRITCFSCNCLYFYEQLFNYM